MNQVTPNFKPDTCVSKPLRDFARGQDCSMRGPYCNNNPETVVLCHTRMAGFNGINCKPLDFLGYHGCSDCHAHELEMGYDDIYRAVAETLSRAFQAGLITVKGAK
jgi:hypothetical protein